MTTLKSKVIRRTEKPVSFYPRRRIVATLEPIPAQGDFLVLRLERDRDPRRIYRIDLEDLYTMLVRRRAFIEQMDKAKAKAAKRGRRVKRF